MHSWRGLLTHALMALCVPAYIATKRLSNPQYFSQTSLAWLTLAGLSWLWILTRVTIPFLTSPLRHLPAAQGERFILGHLSIFREQPPTNIMLKLIRETPNNGLIVFWGILYLRPHVLATTPETVMEILNGHTYDWEKPVAAKKILGRILGEGLVNVEGNTHKSMRRVVAPAFSGRHVRDLIPLFWDKGVKFADSMARALKSSSDGAVEMGSQMSRVTLDIIGSAGVGKDLNTIENDDDELARLYETITGTDRGSPILFFLVNLLLPQWVITHARGTVHARIAAAILELRQSIRNLLAEKKTAMELKTAEQKDIIAIIMRSGSFDDDYLVSQLLTFLAAGHDTTASALTFTSWLLATNPDVQERLRKECREALSGRPAEDVDVELLDRMPYLTACCNETLRLYPTVPITSRHAVVPTRIGDLVMPKGVFAFISPWAMNRLSSLWGPDADKFRPERWLQGPLAATGGARSAYALITFLHGPRSCIGQSFAKNEMRCILAALILRFRFEKTHPAQSIEVGGFVTIKPKGGLKLKLHDLQSTS